MSLFDDERLDDRFDEQLRKALARKQPSANFTARVLAASEKAEANRSVRGWMGTGWIATDWIPTGWMPLWATPALASVLVLGMGLTYHQYERQRAGEHARDQLLVALRLTGVKLHDAQAKVAGIAGENYGRVGDGREGMTR